MAETEYSGASNIKIKYSFRLQSSRKISVLAYASSAIALVNMVIVLLIILCLFGEFLFVTKISSSDRIE